MNNLNNLQNILENLTAIYKKLREFSSEEQNSIVELDIQNLIHISESKKYLSLKINELKNEIKKNLKQCNVKNMSEFIKIQRMSGVKLNNLETTANNLKHIIHQFKKSELLNMYLIVDHLKFYNAIFSIYSTITSPSVYNKNATIDIEKSKLSLKV